MRWKNSSSNSDLVAPALHPPPEGGWKIFFACIGSPPLGDLGGGGLNVVVDYAE